MAEKLRPRELELLRMRALGMTVDAIAKDLGISRNMLFYYQTAALEALEVACVIDAFRKLGWLHVPLRGGATLRRRERLEMESL